jgi:hypothetical protein
MASSWAQDQDLQLLRATLAAEQTDEREQVPDNEIDTRPEQTALPHHDDEQPNLAALGRVADEFANPTRLRSLSELAPGS